jgi:hypothetical protein
MALIRPLPHDHAGDICESGAGDIQDTLNVTAIAMSRSMARIGKADEAPRRSDAALLNNQHIVARSRQLLDQTHST